MSVQTRESSQTAQTRAPVNAPQAEGSFAMPQSGATSHWAQTLETSDVLPAAQLSNVPELDGPSEPAGELTRRLELPPGVGKASERQHTWDTSPLSRGRPLIRTYGSNESFWVVKPKEGQSSKGLQRAYPESSKKSLLTRRPKHDDMRAAMTDAKAIESEQDSERALLSVLASTEASETVETSASARGSESLRRRENLTRSESLVRKQAWELMGVVPARSSPTRQTEQQLGAPQSGESSPRVERWLDEVQDPSSESSERERELSPPSLAEDELSFESSPPSSAAEEENLFDVDDILEEEPSGSEQSQILQDAFQGVPPPANQPGPGVATMPESAPATSLLARSAQTPNTDESEINSSLLPLGALVAALPPTTTTTSANRTASQQALTPIRIVEDGGVTRAEGGGSVTVHTFPSVPTTIIGSSSATQFPSVPTTNFGHSAAQTRSPTVAGSQSEYSEAAEAVDSKGKGKARDIA
jgi:hypothetical protein